MDLVADKGLPYDGRRVKKGELFTVNRRAHAKVLIAIGKAHAASPSEIEAHKESKKADKLKAKMARREGLAAMGFAPADAAVSRAEVERSAPVEITPDPALAEQPGPEESVSADVNLGSVRVEEPTQDVGETNGPVPSQNRRRRGRRRNAGAGDN